MKTFVSLLALVSATPALAQSAPPTTSDTAADPFDFQMAGQQLPTDILVVANRSGTPERASDVPASITVITDQQLQDRQIRNVSDVLRDVPGVAVNRSIGGLTDIRIRGTEANHVLVLIDGIEVSDPYQGQYDFGTLIADEGSRIEVLRGQQSSLYGSDAIGGVIQYTTLSGTEAPGLRVRAEAGSDRTAAGAARFAGASGSVDYVASASLYRTDGTPTARGGTRDIGYTGIGATARLGWQAAQNLRFTAIGRYSYTDSLSNNSDFDTESPTFGTIVDSPGTHFRNEAYYGLVRGELTLADGRWTNRLEGQIADTTRTGFSPFGIDYGDHGQRLKGSFVSAYRFDTGAATHTLTGAVDVERETFRNTTPSPFTFQGERSTDNVGLVGQYEVRVGPRFDAGASIRHDANNRFADTTTYRVQAGYRIADGIRVHGAYGTGVKNPGYYELYGYSDGRYIGNPNLKPERSEGWEAGVDYALDSRLSLGATYFDSALHDEIYTDYPAPLFVATPSNRATLSRQHGVELFATARPATWAKLDIAYTFLTATENGTREVRRPAHIGSANLTLNTPDRRLSGTLTVRYNGAQDDLAYTDPSFVPVRVRLADYTLVNLSAEYRLTDVIAVFGRVENLFDERYEEVFSFATPGRSAVGGVRARF